MRKDRLSHETDTLDVVIPKLREFLAPVLAAAAENQELDAISKPGGGGHRGRGDGQSGWRQSCNVYFAASALESIGAEMSTISACSDPSWSFYMTRLAISARVACSDEQNG